MAGATVKVKIPQATIDAIDALIRERVRGMEQAIRDAHRAGYEAGVARGRMGGLQRPHEQSAWEDYRCAVRARDGER